MSDSEEIQVPEIELIIKVRLLTATFAFSGSIVYSFSMPTENGKN